MREVKNIGGKGGELLGGSRVNASIKAAGTSSAPEWGRDSRARRGRGKRNGRANPRKA